MYKQQVRYWLYNINMFNLCSRYVDGVASFVYISIIIEPLNVDDILYIGYRQEGDGTCLTCQGSAPIIIIVFILAILILGYIAIKLNQLRFIREVSIPLRTGAVYFQTLGLLFALDVEWPDAVETSLDVADTSSNVATSQWLGCVASFSERW
jgi:hypothetical protein